VSILPSSLTIRSFGDAVGVALALADEYAYVHAGLLLDPYGRVAAMRLTKLGAQAGAPPWADASISTVAAGFAPDGILAWPSAADTGPDFDRVVWWFLRQPHRWPGPVPGAALVISVRAAPLNAVGSLERQRQQRLAGVVRLSGYRLLDWIETDGDCVRSHAYLADPDTAWPADSVDDRHRERSVQQRQAQQQQSPPQQAEQRHDRPEAASSADRNRRTRR
jgi:hypothetical protein